MRSMLFALFLSSSVVCGGLTPETALAQSETINASGSYKVGDYVEVWGNFWGPVQWNKCKILEIKDGKYLIHYGGGKYNTKWIEEKDIRNEAKEKAEKAQQEMQSAFWKEVTPTYTVSVGQFIGVYRKGLTGPGNSMYGPPSNAEQLTKALSELSTLNGICTSKYKGLKDTETISVNDYTKLPGSWCEVAAKRNEIAKTIVETQVKALNTQAKEDLTKRAKDLEPVEPHVVAGSWYKDLYSGKYSDVKGIGKTSWLEDLIKNDGKGSVDELKKSVAALYQSIGATEPASQAAFYEEYAKGLIELKATFEKNLPAPVFVATGKDSSMQAAGAKGISGKILKHAVISPAWVVTVNSKGTPIDRIKVGTVLYQDGANCVYRSYVWKQVYAGGKYGAGSVVESSEYYQRCK